MSEVAPPPPPVRTVIVDDEREAREGLRALVEAEPGFEVTAVCSGGRDAVEVLDRGAADLVLLDVQMPGMDGFDVLGALEAEERPVVVFITAYDRYALAAFEAHALDYVLKPFSDERLRTALRRAGERVRLRRVGRVGRRLAALLDEVTGSGSAASESPLTRLVARSGGRVHFIPVESIDRITAEDYYVRVHSGERSHLIRDSLKRLESRLPADLFVRTHRSAIVNVRRLRAVETTEGGRREAVLEDGSRVPVARSRLAAVVEAVRGEG